MEVTILGKYGPYPPLNGACSGYLVRQEDTELLLDCGSGTLSRLYKYTRPEKLKGIYISHLHFDHISDLLPLRYAVQAAGAKINVFVAYEDSDIYRLIAGIPEFNIINIDEDSRLTVGGLELTFYRMKHTVLSYAVRIKGERTVVYSGDTMYNDNLLAAAKGADALIADCSQPAGTSFPHMTVEDGIKLAVQSGVRLIASHIHPDYDPRQYFETKGGVETAEEFRTYRI